MERIQLGGWWEAFQDSLPENCKSIARMRKTTARELKKLPFDLATEDVESVIGALKEEPLESELAAAGSGGPNGKAHKALGSGGGASLVTSLPRFGTIRPCFDSRLVQIDG